jgi:hypothetical protein
VTPLRCVPAPVPADSSTGGPAARAPAGAADSGAAGGGVRDAAAFHHLLPTTPAVTPGGRWSEVPPPLAGSATTAAALGRMVDRGGPPWSEGPPRSVPGPGVGLLARAQPRAPLGLQNLSNRLTGFRWPNSAGKRYIILNLELSTWACV